MARDLYRIGHAIRTDAHNARQYGSFYTTENGQKNVLYRNRLIARIETLLSLQAPAYAANVVIKGHNISRHTPDILDDLRYIVNVPHFYFALDDEEIVAFKDALEKEIADIEDTYCQLVRAGRILFDAAA
jgi:hypothetical protein